MDEREVARYWEENAKTWTPLVRRGFDVSFLHVLCRKPVTTSPGAGPSGG